MQAPLSSTASGKIFHTGPLTAVLPVTPCRTLGADSAGLYPTHNRMDSLAEGAGLAHDAGNLLGALGLYCELLALPGVLREEHRHYAEELQLLSGRSRELIDRLLNPAITGRRGNGRAGATPLSLNEVPLPSVDRVVVPDVIEGCRGLLNAVTRRAIRVAYEAGAALPVAVSREALERILVNLAKNAAEASTPEGAITLRVTCRREEPAARIVLTVEDKGRGLSSAAVKVLLGDGEPGPQKTALHLRRRVPRGIGFRVVRELVGASGGQLRMFSHTGGDGADGTTGTAVEIAWAVAAEDDAGAEPAMPDEYVPKKAGERRGLMLMAGNKGKNSVGPGRLSC